MSSKSGAGEAPVKAALVVVLKADDVVVAEIKDAELWQRVLSAINSGDGGAKIPDGSPGAGEGVPPPDRGLRGSGSPDSSAVGQLAAQIGVEVAQLQGACSPSASAPYLHLDPHCWEAMKDQLPQRGQVAISAIAAASTLLGLWFQKAGLGNPTQAQALAVLSGIHVTEKNASRGIQNSPWLQGRSGGQVVLNPAEISKAAKLARCFCSKDWSAWKDAAK